MRQTLSCIVAVALAAVISPAAFAADVSAPVASELLFEEQVSDAGLDIHVAVTRDSEGVVLGEAIGIDPTSGDEVEVWTDGTTLWWTGVVGGQTGSGAMLVADMLTVDGQPAAFCFTPITAVACLVGAALLFGGGGCAHFINCKPTGHTTDPCDGGPCTPPPAPGEGGGGDSSSEDDDDDGSSDD